MTDLISLPPRDPAEPNFAELLEGLTPMVVAAGLAMVVLYRWAEETAHNAQEKHLRAERLAAYRVRRRWKASDIRPLLTIGVNAPAQRRIAALQGTGRPVVRPHRPLEEVLSEKLTSWFNLLREDATPSERRRSFRVWPWWKHHVEALYRGELHQARATGVKGPHDHAERIVADALHMSQGSVHMLCGEIRAKRRADADSANFPPMTLSAYENWMEHGVLPTGYAD
jgi:hypothetical protein